MAKTFKIGDHVSWKSEAGWVSGRIIGVHTSDVNYKGYVHHANEDDPQYEIRSDKTDHIALHKGKALRHLVPLTARFPLAKRCSFNGRRFCGKKCAPLIKGTL